MIQRFIKFGGVSMSAIFVMLLILAPAGTDAAIPGIDQTGTLTPVFELTAKKDYISTPDGNAILMWGYAYAGGIMQFPGPTLKVKRGAIVTVNLTNQPLSEVLTAITVPTSIVFPGHKVQATGGSPGMLTREAAPGETVSYTFVATHPGTYTYYSGTNPDLQIEMGMVGTIIVYPIDERGANYAYDHADSYFDREYLEVLDDMDLDVHLQVEAGNMNQVDSSNFFPEYWFINGRAFPDTIDELNAAWLPTQPYDALVVMNAGQKVLIRLVGAGRDIHPQHLHSNNGLIIGRDGRMLMTAAGNGAYQDVNTINPAPGQTVDFIFTWTGQDLGWDFYGHTLGDPTAPKEVHDRTTLASPIGPAASTLQVGPWVNGIAPETHKINAIVWDSISYTTFEAAAANNAVEMITMKKDLGTADTYAIERSMHGTTAMSWSAGVRIDYTDHGKPFPVVLPELQDLTFGGAYSGSPFLGAEGALPPGEGGLNPGGGFGFPWHSHAEKELLNNDVFIGGMMTLMFVLPALP